MKLSSPILKLSSPILRGAAAVLAVAACASALTLAASRPAHTAGGPIPVNVANTVSIQDTENPAKQPFQQAASAVFADGSDSADSSIAVPAGKRLVVETVAVSRSGVLGNTSSHIYLGATLNGNTVYYPLPVLGVNGVDAPGMAQMLRFYADPASTLSLYASRSGSSGRETDVVTVSGYLVNVP